MALAAPVSPPTTEEKQITPEEQQTPDRGHDTEATAPTAPTAAPAAPAAPAASAALAGDDNKKPAGDGDAPDALLPAHDGRSASHNGGSASYDEKLAGEDGAPDAPPPQNYLYGLPLYAVLASVNTMAFLMLLDMSVIVVAIPSITTEFGSLPDIGWYGSAYALASAALQPLAGKLYTYLHPKWTFLGFLLLFEIGSLVCGLATSSAVLIAGRTIAGAGTAGIQNGAMTIIASAAPLDRRPLMFGFLIGFAQFGMTLGPLVGGALTEFSTWRWCFYINLPLGGLAAAGLVLSRIPDGRAARESSWISLPDLLRRLDLPGFAIFCPAVAMFLLALEWGGTRYPWRSAVVIGLLCGSAAMLGLFLLWQHRIGDRAMLPLSLFRVKEMWAASLTSFFMIASMHIPPYYLPIYFQTVRRANPWMGGLDMLPGMIGQMIGAVSSGFLIQRVGYYLPVMFCGSALVAVGNGLITTFTPYTPISQWVGYQLFLGFSRGVGIQVPQVAVQASSIPPSGQSVAMSTVFFCQTLGATIWLTAANTLFNNELVRQLTRRIPGVDARAVIAAGATGLETVLPERWWDAGRWSYAKSVDAVFYMAIAAAIGNFVFTPALGWRDIRTKKPAERV